MRESSEKLFPLGYDMRRGIVLGRMLRHQAHTLTKCFVRYQLTNLVCKSSYISILDDKAIFTVGNDAAWTITFK